jgi:outer membrane phospholipase A
MTGRTNSCGRAIVGAALLAGCAAARLAAQVPAGAGAVPGANIPAAVTTNPPTNSVLANFIGQRASDYEPIYFILGTYPAAEFQFSLKYRLFSLSPESENPLAHLYFAYTQTSYWDLLTSDPSFYDTSYKPSLFVQYHHALPETIPDPLWLTLQGGAEHESNGRGGTAERSLYTAYLQAPLTFGLRDGLQLTLQPRLWYYLDLGSNNKDLADYRGYGNLLARITWKKPGWSDPVQLEAKLQAGTGFRHTGEELDLRFNLPAWTRFNPTIQIQYFTGYGQTLRQYNESSQGLRVGLCLWYPGLIRNFPSATHP